MAANGVIKVADFGLAEDIYTGNYFRHHKDSSNQIKLPIKWMALESIHDGLFTEKTDVVYISKHIIYYIICMCACLVVLW